MVAALGLLLPGAARGGSPRGELLRLVPPDIGFCLLIEDLRGHGNALLESPFVKQFSRSPLVTQALETPEAQKLGIIDQFLQQYLKVSAIQLRDEILGDALVLAYRPGPVGRPAEEQGLLLVRARDPQLLGGLVERINDLQRASGELRELEERQHAGHRYFHRAEASGSRYYYLRGPVLVFAWQEPILRQVIELDREPGGDGESALSREFRLLGIKKPLAALYINPRAFDPSLSEKAAAATGSQAAGLKALLQYWKALDGLAFSLNLEKDIELTAAFRARPEALPQAARRLLASARAASEVWNRLPEDSMLAAAGRIDVPALIDLLSDFVPEEARRQLRTGIDQTVGAIFGRDGVRQILSAIGPDWGVAVLAPSTDEKSWIPTALAAVRVGKEHKEASLTVWNALQSLATLVVFHQNQARPGALRLGSMVQNGAEVKYLESSADFPPGFTPAVTLRDGYVVAASSAKTLTQFRTNPSSPPSSAEIPLLRLSLRQVSRYLRERRDPLVAYSSTKDQISEEETARRLDHVLSVLQFLDRVEVSQRPGDGSAVLTLRIHFSQPLK
jgi:hypothetical protein